ncbi:MarR family transcriptional regulator [Microlunatus endophyticus]|uniref:MarR family transcriptional regulator n=1 Tax=Microlunatus endophyticus TaxID=1716077 RepID=A0A917VZP8_9ACTN|nr:MarR family transcriptional regulator [Microlunatus endophyticus]GGL48893.1 MarR family transcriptional regulator [Microlunatus endophyticus]
MISAVALNDQPTPRSGRDGGTSHRLGYLFKHVHLRYEQLTSAALEPIGISPREWAALNCLDEQHSLSQREVADLLGIDRTRMVALVDELEAKGWVKRRPQPDDRRKNIVTLTNTGRGLLQRGSRIVDECEQEFLAALSAVEAEQLKNALDAVVATE